MANPLMNTMQNDDRQGLSLGRFFEFAKTYKGDARAEVMKFLQSGQMSGEEFERLKAQAQQIEKLIK